MSAQRQRIRAQRVRVGVTYGMGGSAFAEFPRDEIAGKSAAELIAKVISRPQPSESAARTARVLQEAMRTAREIDAELIRSSRNRADGEPIGLDQVVVAREEGVEQGEGVAVQETEEVTFRVSESYRGGGERCRCRRYAEQG
jgi:hypothetical protein